MNSVNIIGRLGADPEQRGEVVSLRLAVSEGRDKTCWINVKVFGQAREWAMEAKKGDRIALSGRLSQWTSQDGGKSGHEILCSSLMRLDRRDEGGDSRGGYSGGAARDGRGGYGGSSSRDGGGGYGAGQGRGDRDLATRGGAGSQSRGEQFDDEVPF